MRFLPVAQSILLTVVSVAAELPKLPVLIIDGQNNHNWRSTTPIIKEALEKSGRFTVEVSTTPSDKSTPEEWAQWRPEFGKFKAVVSNYNGAPWPMQVKVAFDDYVAGGGGFVCVHAANNSFPEWPQYNRMIGLGGWGGRDEKSGPYVYVKDNAMKCAGFYTVLQRGTEWAATGAVTIPVPAEFPSKEAVLPVK